MVNFEPPELSDRDYVDKTEDTDWLDYAERWKEVTKAIKTLEAEEKELRQALISLADRSSVVGGGIRLSKVIRRGSVDYKSVPNLIGVDLEQYRKEPIETFRIAEEK